MTRYETWIRTGLLLVALVLLYGGSARAHDCSGPSDCETVPNNVARTTAVMSGLAAAELGRRILTNGGANGGGAARDDWGLDEASEDEPPIDLDELYRHELGPADASDVEADSTSPEDAGVDDESLYGSGRDFDRPLGEPSADAEPGDPNAGESDPR